MRIIKLLQIVRVENFICFGFLAGISVYDIVFRRISGLVLLIGGLLAAGYSLLLSDNMWYISMAGAAIGGVLLIIAYVTDEAVGYGDGWLLVVLGTYLGIWALLEVLVSAWVTMAVTAGVCLIKNRWSRNTALPMSPFVMFGFVIFLVCEYLCR